MVWPAGSHSVMISLLLTKEAVNIACSFDLPIHACFIINDVWVFEFIDWVLISELYWNINVSSHVRTFIRRSSSSVSHSIISEQCSSSCPFVSNWCFHEEILHTLVLCLIHHAKICLNVFLLVFTTTGIIRMFRCRSLGRFSFFSKLIR